MDRAAGGEAVDGSGGDGAEAEEISRGAGGRRCGTGDVDVCASGGKCLWWGRGQRRRRIIVSRHHDLAMRRQDWSPQQQQRAGAL